jgi:hypothetical protein
VQLCNTHSCAINGGYGQWTNWEKCTAICT